MCLCNSCISPAIQPSNDPTAHLTGRRPGAKLGKELIRAHQAGSRTPLADFISAPELRSKHLQLPSHLVAPFFPQIFQTPHAAVFGASGASSYPICLLYYCCYCCSFYSSPAMENSLRNILHSSEPSTYVASSILHHAAHGDGQLQGHPQALDKNGPFLGSIEAENILSNDSRKRPATRIKSSYPRKRAIQACQKCRVRRTKCNNARPSCSSCLSIGAECTYSEGDHSRYVMSLTVFLLT